MRRLNSSRPNSSVPRAYCGPGRRSGLAICATGSCGARTGAASATATTIPTSAAPMTATGVLDSARRNRARPARAGSTPRGRAATAGAAPASLIAKGGVEVRVQEVHEEVHEDEGDGKDHHGPLHDRIVALVDAVEERPPEAGQAEDLLGDHHPAQEEAHLEAHDRDD